MTDSPQCPTPLQALSRAACEADDSPTRPEGLDFEMAENGASVHPYTVRVDEKVRARLNAQHRAALDALRARAETWEALAKDAIRLVEHKRSCRLIRSGWGDCDCGFTPLAERFRAALPLPTYRS